MLVTEGVEPVAAEMELVSSLSEWRGFQGAISFKSRNQPVAQRISDIQKDKLVGWMNDVETRGFFGSARK